MNSGTRGAVCQLVEEDGRLEDLRQALTTEDEANDIVNLFRLLGEPTRLRILSALAEAGELSVGSLATVVEASETNVSQALRLLRTANVVANRRAGRTVFYRLVDQRVRALLDLSLEHTTLAKQDHSPLVGTVERISVASESGAPLTIVDTVAVMVGTGLEGDRPGANSARQVSIQSRSELDLASKRLGRPIESDQTRRNITIDTGELPRTPGERLLLGTVELEVFSDAPPCATMTEIIGQGARPALRKLGGIHCRVITSGSIDLGDELHLGRKPATTGPASRTR